MRFVVACALAVYLVGSLSESAIAQNLKKGVTDPAQAGADYHLQGEYAGWVVFSDGYRRMVGLQVVALGDGKFDALWHQGGLPGNGYDGTTRRKLSGKTADGGTVLNADGLVIELFPDSAALVKNSAGGLLGSLQPQQRYSLTEGARPPANAIILFDGKNVDRLKNAKVTADGLLEIGAETKEAYQNFSLHAEFRTPFMPYARGQGRSNSGFYLQKRYEVQVLDSFGLEQQFNDCGAIYRFKAPDLNMCFPPLRWQTYDIDLTAPKFDADGKRIAKGRITVRLNGVVVQNNVELENKTGGGSPEGPNPLPILFQNHGNPVNFRNIWLVDHDAQPASSSCTSPVADCSGAPAACCVPMGHVRHARARRCR